MSFANRSFNGTFGYRVLNSFKAYMEKGNEIPANLDSWASKFRLHPCRLTLPPFSLPAQLDTNAVNFLRENSASSPKSLENRAVLMADYLWNRSLMTKSKLTVKSNNTPKSFEIDESDETLLQFHDPSQLVSNYERDRAISQKAALDSWVSMSYNEINSSLYLVARLAPNFAVACRAFYEIRKRCPGFIPRSLIDFGSGTGSVTWAANTVWPVGLIREHYLIEPSVYMTRLSEFLFAKSSNENLGGTIFPGIFHRRFMLSDKHQSDLVISAYSLLELPDFQSRSRVISSLWNKTSNFLVLIEQGNKAGFQAILEARDWLIKNGGSDLHLFAPCPHALTCGKKDSICNVNVRYYQFELTRTKNEPVNELTSYLIVSRGDWRRHQSPIVEPDPIELPRIVSRSNSKHGTITQDLCLPSGSVERTTFSRQKTERNLRFFMRFADAGDIAPIEKAELEDCPDTKENVEQINDDDDGDGDDDDDDSIPEKPLTSFNN